MFFSQHTTLGKFRAAPVFPPSLLLPWPIPPTFWVHNVDGEHSPLLFITSLLSLWINKLSLWFCRVRDRILGLWVQRSLWRKDKWHIQIGSPSCYPVPFEGLQTFWEKHSSRDYIRSLSAWPPRGPPGNPSPCLLSSHREKHHVLIQGWELPMTSKSRESLEGQSRKTEVRDMSALIRAHPEQRLGQQSSVDIFVVSIIISNIDWGQGYSQALSVRNDLTWTSSQPLQSALSAFLFMERLATKNFLHPIPMSLVLLLFSLNFLKTKSIGYFLDTISLHTIRCTHFKCTLRWSFNNCIHLGSHSPNQCVGHVHTPRVGWSLGAGQSQPPQPQTIDDLLSVL